MGAASTLRVFKKNWLGRAVGGFRPSGRYVVSVEIGGIRGVIGIWLLPYRSLSKKAPKWTPF